MKPLLALFLVLNMTVFANHDNNPNLPPPPVSTPALLNIDVQAEQKPFTEVRNADRAADYAEAFANLQARNPDGNIFAVVKGRSIDHIVDLKVLPQGSLLMLVTRHRERENQLVVRVEELEQLGVRSGRSDGPAVELPASWK